MRFKERSGEVVLTCYKINMNRNSPQLNQGKIGHWYNETST